MATIQYMRNCVFCGRPTLHLKQVESNVFHLLMTLVTAGLWIVVWMTGPLRRGDGQCTVCGHTWLGGTWARLTPRQKTRVVFVGGGLLIALILIGSPEKEVTPSATTAVQPAVEAAPILPAAAEAAPSSPAVQPEPPRLKVAVIVPSANIRAEPSKSSQVVGTLDRGTIVWETGRESGWVGVATADSPPVIGWVHESLLGPAQATVSVGKATPDENILRRACKATIAMLMSHDPSIIRIDSVEASVVRLHYVRPGDGTTWRYLCRLDGKRVIWAAVFSDGPGRWRTHPDDEYLTFTIEGDQIKITESYSDGSRSDAVFPLSSL